MSAEPICIRRVASIEEAQLIVDYLADNDIQATIADPANPGVFAFGVTDIEGISIFADAGAVARANQLLEEHDRDVPVRRPATGTVTAVCEECGASCQFPAALAGTVQDCKECHAYMDVPGDEAV